MPERRADLEHDLGRVGVQDGWIARPLRLQCQYVREGRVMQQLSHRLLRRRWVGGRGVLFM